MGEINIGDIVARKSYGGDIYFRVAKIDCSQGNKCAVLRGLYYRLVADAPLDDLEKKNSMEINMSRFENTRRQSQQVMKAMNHQRSRVSLL